MIRGVRGWGLAGCAPGKMLLVLSFEVATILHWLVATLKANKITVDSQYLELRYLEFFKSAYLYQKYILIAFYNYNLALDIFLQVQITRSAN